MKISPKVRDAFIKEHCTLSIEPCEWDNGKEWISVYMDGCYLTSGYSLTKIIEDSSVIDFLINRGISKVESVYEDSKVACVGFSKEDNTWYGWSHRGACWFTIGSEVKKGDVAYNPASKEDFEENELAFWCGEDSGIVNARIETNTDGRTFIIGMWKEDIPNEKMRGKTYLHEIHYPETYGRGEWKAESLEDAHQMAIDYAKNIG